MLQESYQDVAKVESRSCIYMHVASMCLKCFRCFIHLFQVFHLDVAYFGNGFQVVLGVFANVSDACFICFIYLYLYVATVVSECCICL